MIDRQVMSIWHGCVLSVDGLKANGWKSINNCGMWENFCPDCVRNVIFNPGASEFAGLK